MAAPTTTLYLRGMPVAVTRKAKAAAARRGVTLARVVAEALERTLAADDKGHAPADSFAARDALAEAIAWYEHHRPTLGREYGGEYIAIVDGAVIDHDRDFEPLATRVFNLLGTGPVFMPRVGRGERIARVRSPHRVRA